MHVALFISMDDGMELLWAYALFRLLYENALIPFFQGNEGSVKPMSDGSDISRFHSCCCDNISGFLIGVPQKTQGQFRLPYGNSHGS